MKGHEWMQFCIENRTSAKQKEIMLNKRINQHREKRIVEAFREKEKEWFVMVALDTTRRHTLNFATEDHEGNVFWAEYSKKEKRFTNVAYVEDGCWHYIFLKHSVYNEKAE